MYPQMTQISPIEAHLCHLKNLWMKIQVIREDACGRPGIDAVVNANPSQMRIQMTTNAPNGGIWGHSDRHSFHSR